MIGLFKTECIRTIVFDDKPYRTINDVEFATAGWVAWWNNRRLHGTVRMMTPTEAEQAVHSADSAVRACSYCRSPDSVLAMPVGGVGLPAALPGRKEVVRDSSSDRPQSAPKPAPTSSPDALHVRPRRHCWTWPLAAALFLAASRAATSQLSTSARVSFAIGTAPSSRPPSSPSTKRSNWRLYNATARGARSTDPVLTPARWRQDVQLPAEIDSFAGVRARDRMSADPAPHVTVTERPCWLPCTDEGTR